MTLALWTPTPAAPWARALATALGEALEVVAAAPAARPAVELDLYHVAGRPEHGFVYRALLDRPGVVLLAEWNLHALVHAETAGRGDAAAYLREARHAHGDRGVFVARQVLLGLGGALTALLPLNQRVLEHALAVAASSDDLRELAVARGAGTPVVHIALEPPASDSAAPGTRPEPVAALLDLLQRTAASAPAERDAIAERVRAEATARGGALDELRWSARELGLGEPPADAVALVAALFETGP